MDDEALIECVHTFVLDLSLLQHHRTVEYTAGVMAHLVRGDRAGVGDTLAALDDAALATVCTYLACKTDFVPRDDFVYFDRLDLFLLRARSSIDCTTIADASALTRLEHALIRHVYLPCMARIVDQPFSALHRMVVAQSNMPEGARRTAYGILWDSLRTRACLEFPATEIARAALRMAQSMSGANSRSSPQLPTVAQQYLMDCVYHAAPAGAKVLSC